MWNPIDIKFVNLFAHKDSFYKFSTNECTVIFGQNATDIGMDNNGAGKSTLFEAIYLACTGESLRDMNKEDFINRDEENCDIVFNLRNDHLNMSLKIVRKFMRGSKSNIAQVWENGKENTKLVSVGECNKRILELLGITRDDLQRYFIIHQDSKYTFFTASDTEKKDIMNRITSADLINPIFTELESRSKEKSTALNEKIRSETELLIKEATLAEQLETIENINLAADEIEEYQLKIKTHEDKITKNLQNKKSIELDISSYEKGLSEQVRKLNDKDKLLLKRRKLKDEYNHIANEITSGNKLVRDLKNELEEEIICPNCDFHFINDSTVTLTIDEIKNLLSEAESGVVELKKQLDVKEREQNKNNKEIEENEVIEEEIYSLTNKVKKLKKDIEEIKSDIKTSENNIDKYTNSITQLKNQKDNKQIRDLKDKIKSLDSEIGIVVKEREKLQKEYDMIKYWQFYMGKNGFTTYLANKSIKIIEGITNSYLKKFGVDLMVLINGFKILKSKEVREKIDVFVQYQGIRAEKFMSKSGGERGRINLAGIIGIHHLINLSSSGKGLNLLMLDESFPGIDQTGQENIIKILEKLGITVIMIVQNVSEGFNNKNKLIVQKVDEIAMYVGLPKL